jgi:hypothetical protein
MVANANALPPILQRVEEALAMWLERNAAVERAGENVGQIALGADVADMELRLVLAAAADPVHDSTAVLRYGVQRHVGRVIRGKRMGIEEDVVPIPLLDMPRPEVVVGAMVRHEQTPAVLEGRPAIVVLLERREACANRVAALDPVEDPMCVRVLRVDPGPRLGAVLIFEPAIRIDELDTVHDLADVVAPGRRRLGHRRRGRARDGSGARQSASNWSRAARPGGTRGATGPDEKRSGESGDRRGESHGAQSARLCGVVQRSRHGVALPPHVPRAPGVPAMHRRVGPLPSQTSSGAAPGAT